MGNSCTLTWSGSFAFLASGQSFDLHHLRVMWPQNITDTCFGPCWVESVVPAGLNLESLHVSHTESALQPEVSALIHSWPCLPSVGSADNLTFPCRQRNTARGCRRLLQVLYWVSDFLMRQWFGIPIWHSILVSKSKMKVGALNVILFLVSR